MPTIAVMSLWMNDPRYLFSAVVSCWLWKHEIGVTPLVILLQTNDERELNALNSIYWYEKLASVGAIVKSVMINTHNKRQASQFARLAAVAAWSTHDDYLFITDADLLPVKKKWFNEWFQQKYDIHATSSNPDHLMKRQMPMCYVGMKGHVWSRLLQCTIIRYCLYRMLKHSEERATTWFFDQRVMFVLVKNAMRLGLNVLLQIHILYGFVDTIRHLSKIFWQGTRDLLILSTSARFLRKKYGYYADHQRTCQQRSLF
jgi:hypothetical protein